jgi:UDP-4-amino-4,6-dideoxy-N-acetyl-beta-L-altrosamine N-acetyltransferase
VIKLRDLQDDDSARLFAWRRDAEVDRWMRGLPPSDPEAHQAWFDAFRADGSRAGWIVTIDGAPCGWAALTNITAKNRRAEWGWYIGEPRARGRGAGRAAQALGLDRAFGDLGLEKVWSEVLAENEIALKAQAGAGFRREGYLRRHVWKDDRFHDAVLLGVLRDEWEAKRDAARRDLAQSGLLAA